MSPKKKIDPSQKEVPTTEPSKETIKSPVEILEELKELMQKLDLSISRFGVSQSDSQDVIVSVMKDISEYIGGQNRILNDFSLQVSKLTRSQTSFETLGEVIFNMQTKFEEDREVIRQYRKETRAVAKAIIHAIDVLRNQCIDLMHIWREE